MRKQDYETLARELKHVIHAWDKNADPEDLNTQMRMHESMCAWRLAKRLSEYLHVDRAAFLTACGISP